jgi:magnesium chelatase family protein
VKEKKFNGIFIPHVNAREAAVIRAITVYPVVSLTALFRHLNQTEKISPHPYISFDEISENIAAEFDLADVKGQFQARRALEISAAGGHNMHMRGVPGAGKTMLARSLPGILPHLTEEESLEVTKIYSITGNIPEGASIIKTRPFRSPHHTVSRIGLIGGGAHPIPGEISLAHRGVLFLDEFPEYPRSVLEAMRQPIEDGIVTISRAAGTIAYPAKFVLLAASNPCPCGYYGDTSKKCRCLPGQVANYKKRISGPIMDRIDLHLELSAVEMDKLTNIEVGESSKSVQARVQKARNIQTERYKNIKAVCNSDLSAKQVKELIPLSSECLQILRQAITTLHLSARSYYRIIKVSRTIADLERSNDISVNHIAEALQYRYKEEQ